MNINNRDKILFISFIGFVLTGFFFYPYGIFWDSARTLSFILVDGHANIDNWLGWYFPLLWEVLYKLTGVPNIMGTWIILLYWIGITLLYLNLFNVEKRSLWWYVAFAWFPGSLLFIMNITNNALMMVMLLLGLSFFLIFEKKKKWGWAVLSLFTIIQCAFIRRESFVMVLPLVFVLLFIIFWQYHSKWHAFFLSMLSGIFILVAVFGIEKSITQRIPGYDYMDALSITCLHDMAAVTYTTGKMYIPKHIFKKDYSDGNTCLSDILSIENGADSIFNGDIMFRHIGPYMQIKDRYMVNIPKSEVLDFYKNNILEWLKFRFQYGYQFFRFKQQMCYVTKFDNDMIKYIPPSPSLIQRILSYAFPALFGSLLFFYYLSFVIILLDWIRWIYYRTKEGRLLIFTLLLIVAFETIVVLFTSISFQYRYLYPVCVLQYLLFIYVLSRLKYQEIAARILYFEY